MAEDDRLGLSDFAALLVDETLAALIRSLENQIEWREQIAAIDGLDEEEIVAGLSLADVGEWLADADPALPRLLERWEALGGEGAVRVEDEEQSASLLRILREVEARAASAFAKTRVLAGSAFDPTVADIMAHLARSMRKRLNLMKEMGLPALVAERVEIRSRIDLAVAPQADGSAHAASRKSVESKAPGDVESARSGRLARPVKARIFGILKDLEAIRSRLPATETHRVTIHAAPRAEQSDERNWNAEISITLRSHFF